jgi:hypothetical protein
MRCAFHFEDEVFHGEALGSFGHFCLTGRESRNHVSLNRFRTVLFEVLHLRILGWPKRLPVSRLRVLLNEVYLPVPELVYSVGACPLFQRVQIGLEHFSLPLT